MDVLKKIRNYTLNERHCLGEGSFGKVYEATSDDNRKVAIKKVDQKLIISDRYLKQSLDNEINTMQKLKHPNIVQLYQVITTANNIYLVMQFCSGGDLKRFCSTRKLNEQMALNVIKQIAKGFEQMIKFGIIHRDLKPANILVHQNSFKICDFGFAKFFGEAGKMSRTFVGTPIYMSPQVLSQKQYTNKTDVWSLGVMFYQLLFGKIPYNGYSQQELLRNIVKGNLYIPQCSKESVHLLQGMLVIQQANRWSWDDVFDSLFGRSPNNRIRPNPTSNNAIFYVNQLRGKQKSYEQKRPQKKQYEVHAKSPPVIANNNYLQNIYEDKIKQQNNRRAPIGRNMLIPKDGKADIQDIYLAPAQKHQDKDVDENPRFFYFLLVEFIVNTIEGSLSFDSFIYNLWKYTILLYERLLEKAQVINVQLYRNVLLNQLNEIKNLEAEFIVKKQGNLRSLADLVYQQSKSLPINKKSMIWLKRFIDKKYNYEAIE